MLRIRTAIKHAPSFHVPTAKPFDFYLVTETFIFGSLVYFFSLCAFIYLSIYLFNSLNIQDKNKKKW